MASINPSDPASSSVLDPDCGICFEPLAGKSVSGHVVPVQISADKVSKIVAHFYHTECLRTYHTQNPNASCPACRGLLADCSVEVLSSSSNAESSSDLKQTPTPFAKPPSPTPQQSVSCSSAQAIQVNARQPATSQNLDYVNDSDSDSEPLNLINWVDWLGFRQIDSPSHSAPQQSVSCSSAQALQGNARPPSPSSNLDYMNDSDSDSDPVGSFAKPPFNQRQIPTSPSTLPAVRAKLLSIFQQDILFLEQLERLIKEGDADSFEKIYAETMLVDPDKVCSANRCHLLHLALDQSLIYLHSTSPAYGRIISVILEIERRNFPHDDEISRDQILELIKKTINIGQHDITHILLNHYSTNFHLEHALFICQNLIETVVSYEPRAYTHLLYTIINMLPTLTYFDGRDHGFLYNLSRECCDALRIVLHRDDVPEIYIENAVNLVARYGDAALMRDLMAKCPRPLTEEERTLALSRAIDPEMIKILQPSKGCSIM